MEKDDHTYFVLRTEGYAQEWDTLHQAIDQVNQLRDDMDYEIIKVVEKVVARRGNP